MWWIVYRESVLDPGALPSRFSVSSNGLMGPGLYQNVWEVEMWWGGDQQGWLTNVCGGAVINLPHFVH